MKGGKSVWQIVFPEPSTVRIDGFTVDPEAYPVNWSEVPGTLLSPIHVNPPSALNSMVPRLVG